MSGAFSSPHALDPDRPWITDVEQLPSNMNWFDTLFNPAGRSPKLHFTRAWTALFVVGVIGFCGFGMAAMVLSMLIDGETLATAHKYFLVFLFSLTSALSLIIHIRRLNHAGKSPLWALIVLLPLLVASALFFQGVQEKAAAYDKLYEARAEFLADPAAWRAAQLEKKRAAQAEQQKKREEAEAARAAAEAAGEEAPKSDTGERRGGRGGPGNWNRGPTADKELPEMEAFIVRPNLPAFYLTIIGLNALVMIWSLLWVARTGVKQPDETDIFYAS